MKVAAAVLLLLLSLAALSASWIAPDGGQMQFRDHINEPPSSQFPLGTDPLGRDRFARLLSGARISLLLAPAAALLAVLLGAVIGIAAGEERGELRQQVTGEYAKWGGATGAEGEDVWGAEGKVDAGLDDAGGAGPTEEAEEGEGHQKGDWGRDVDGDEGAQGEQEEEPGES